MYRYSVVETTIETNTPLDGEEDVMDFYNSVITPQDRERILAAYNEEGGFWRF